MSSLIERPALADRLLEARRSGAVVSVAPAEMPRSEAAAYAVQHTVAATFGEIGGWKVGASGPDAAPGAAPLPAAVIMPSPAVLSPAFSDHLVEAEIAFRIGTDLPPRTAPYTRAEVLAAIASCHPVVEVVQWRIADWRSAPPTLKLADNQGHGGLVVGEAAVDWTGIDFAGLGVTQEITGQATKHGTGNPAGDMIRLIIWLADEGAVWAGGLKAGQIVTCGSWTGITEASAGAPIVVRFAGLSPVELRFQAPAP
jgi:2-keto-4-pentenoate hydratase